MMLATSTRTNNLKEKGNNNKKNQRKRNAKRIRRSSSCIKESRLQQDIHGTSKPHKEKENKGPHFCFKTCSIKRNYEDLNT
jgi:hypothetical protein